MATPDKVLELVERFDYNLSSSRSSTYNYRKFQGKSIGGHSSGYGGQQFGGAQGR